MLMAPKDQRIPALDRQCHLRTDRQQDLGGHMAKWQTR